MKSETTPSVSITETVYDFLMVHINCYSLQNSSIGYIIYNQFKQQMRKGNFTGHTVQLRMSHLEDGQYNFNLLVEEQQLELSIPFQKRSVAQYAELAIAG
jgi:hypothetical protein